MNTMKQFLPATEANLKFVTEQEPWTIYRLEDGSRVKVRLNLVRATATGKVMENGVPKIKFQFTQIMDYEPVKS